jgi:hypothetical protein
VIATRNREAVTKIEVGGADDKLTVRIVGAVGFRPAVHRISRASDGIIYIHYGCAFYFEHCTVPPTWFSVSSIAYFLCDVKQKAPVFPTLFGKADKKTKKCF